MTWLVIKSFFNKAWEFIKKYWKILVGLVYGAFVWLYFAAKAKKAKEVLDIANESHTKEVDILNKSHEDELEERDEIIQKYLEVLEKIEKEYKSKKLVLEEKKKDEIKKLVKENADNPGALALAISEKFDIIYIESGEIE